MWPLARHSVYGEEATVAFVEPGVGARLVESKDGEPDTVWGTATRWVPGELIVLTWHPGRSPEEASQVSVSFAESAESPDRTLVTLEHTGWEIFGDEAWETRTSYEQGWPTVLDAYAARTAAG